MHKLTAIGVVIMWNVTRPNDVNYKTTSLGD